MRGRMALIGLVVSTSAWAVPPTLTHQARVFDAVGAPLEGDHSVRFRLYGVATGGTELWSETATVPFVDGVMTHELGSVTALDLDGFDGSTRWLSVAIDAGAELSPRSAIVSVPYALKAGEADVATSVSGGPVDATEIRVDGQVVIDADGLQTTVSFDDLLDVPPALLDGDDDALGDLSCTHGQVPVAAASGWACADPNAHTHAADHVTTGTFAVARLPIGTTSGTVAAGDHAHALVDLTGDLPLTRTTGDLPLTRTTGDLPLTRTTGDLPLSRTTGDVPIGRLPVGTTAGTVKAGDAPDADVLGGLQCSEGQVARYLSGVWTCAGAPGADVARYLLAGPRWDQPGVTWEAVTRTYDAAAQTMRMTGWSTYVGPIVRLRIADPDQIAAGTPLTVRAEASYRCETSDCDTGFRLTDGTGKWCEILPGDGNELWVYVDGWTAEQNLAAGSNAGQRAVRVDFHLYGADTTLVELSSLGGVHRAVWACPRRLDVTTGLDLALAGGHTDEIYHYSSIRVRAFDERTGTP